MSRHGTPYLLSQERDYAFPSRDETSTGRGCEDYNNDRSCTATSGIKVSEYPRRNRCRRDKRSRDAIAIGEQILCRLFSLLGRGGIGIAGIGGIAETGGIAVAGVIAEIGAMASVGKEGRIISTQNIPWNKSLKVMWRRLRGKITKRWSQGGGCERETWGDISMADEKKSAKQGVDYR